MLDDILDQIIGEIEWPWWLSLGVTNQDIRSRKVGTQSQPLSINKGQLLVELNGKEMYMHDTKIGSVEDKKV